MEQFTPILHNSQNSFGDQITSSHPSSHSGKEPLGDINDIMVYNVILPMVAILFFYSRVF